MTPCQRPELLGTGEVPLKIHGGHLFVKLTFQPLLAFVVLTVGTVAMPARVRHEDLVVAIGTLRPHPRTEHSAAVLHGRQRLEVGRQDRTLVLVQELGFKELNER